MTEVTSADTEGPTAMQLDRLRMLSETHLGDPEIFLKEAGHPYSRADAGTMLGAFHCLTKGTKPLPGTQTEYVELITRLQTNRPPRAPRARSEGEEPPMPETKTCTKCGEDKPLDDFYKGQGKCKPCFKQHAKKREAKRKGKTTKGSAEKKSPDRPSRPDPPPVGERVGRLHQPSAVRPPRLPGDPRNHSHRGRQRRPRGSRRSPRPDRQTTGGGIS